MQMKSQPEKIKPNSKHKPTNVHILLSNDKRWNLIHEGALV